VSYIFGELSPPLMTPVFVDGEAGPALVAAILEGGLVLHLRTHSYNVFRAEAQWRGLQRAHSDNPAQRIEHLSGGRLHSQRAHHPQGATPRPPSDLHAQVLPGDLMSPLKHCVVSSPVAWPTHIHTQTHVRVATRVHLGPLFYHDRTRLSSHCELTSHLISISILSIVAGSYFTGKPSPIVLVAPYYFIIREISVDSMAP
jgi:hypothetical protein